MVVGAAWAVTELFPRNGTAMGSWRHGATYNVSVGGSNARVLQLTKQQQGSTEEEAWSAKPWVSTEELPQVYHSMPISATATAPADNTGGGLFSTTFTIPAAIFEQLAARAKMYPIAWTARDRIATWLDPNRLLGSIFIANPKDTWLGQLNLTVDGAPLQVKRSYNSRGLNHSRCFLGFYFDASGLMPDKPYRLELTLPKLERGAFTGVFWQNVETVYE